MKLNKVVIDTNVILSALLSKKGASYKLLMLTGSDKFQIVLSVPLVLEYEEVVVRNVEKTELSIDEIGDIIDYLCSISEHKEIYYLWRPFLKDPDDDMLLELAVSAGCNIIVTYNKNDFKGVDKFGIQVMTAKEFIEEIGDL